MDPAQDQQQSTPKQQVTERLRQANNVLVTVPSNPSVDELAATIGLTLMLNKLEKHATAVFSGNVPSTLEFLKPEETIETNTDSLRDFIVSLDKSKADKLRYKVEENVVKIFITPYRTSITQDDLEFTQGDFNIDAVVALGVSQRDELDQVITAHGRILHDATVIGVTAGQELSEIGQINWQEPAASSLCEMLVSISEALKGGLIDEQIATAFLTGIVAETERFSNPKTTPKVMTMAAQLMAAGANQQLIANELEKGVEEKVPNTEPTTEQTGDPQDVPAKDDGTLSIPHIEEPQPVSKAEITGTPSEPLVPEPASEPASESVSPRPSQPEPLLPPSQAKNRQFLSAEPVQKSDDDFYSPLLGDAPAETPDQPQSEPQSPMPSAQEQQSPLEPAPEPSPEITPEPTLPMPPQPESEEPPAPPAPPVAEPSKPVLPPLPPIPEPDVEDGQIHIDAEGNIIRKTDTDNPALNNSQQPANHTPSPEATPEQSEQALDSGTEPPVSDDATLTEIEESVHSPHITAVESPAGLNDARDAVMSALAGAEPSLDAARTDLNALPLSAPSEPAPYDSFRLGAHDAQAAPAVDVSGNVPVDMTAPDTNEQPNSMAPPPVPPPMFPQ